MEYLRKRWKLILCLGLTVVSVLLWLAVFARGPRSVATVYFLDVGQGDATLIQGKNGVQILLDGGPSRETLAPLSKEMPFFDRSLDVVIEMYPDKDNGGGLPYVLSQYSVGMFVGPNVTSVSTIDAEVKRIVQAKQIQSTVASAGMTLELNDGSYIKILSANIDESIVVKYVYGDTCFLFMGNAQEKTEKSLIALQGETLQCQVLKVGHHGSKSATGDALLSAVQSQYAVISVGKDNRYAYPNQEVLDRLVGQNVKILNTLELGTIKFATNGEKVLVK